MFKFGDKVKIVRNMSNVFGETYDPTSETYANRWTDDMDKYVGNGETYTISSVDRTGIHLNYTGFGWPAEAFDLVEDVEDLPHFISKKSYYVVGSDHFDTKEEAAKVYVQAELNKIFDYRCFCFNTRETDDILQNRDALIKLLEESKKWI